MEYMAQFSLVLWPRETIMYTFTAQDTVYAQHKISSLLVIKADFPKIFDEQLVSELHYFIKAYQLVL